MKKFALSHIAILMALLLTGCTAHWPDADPNVLWVSSDSDIWFVGGGKDGPTGQLTNGDEVIDVIMLWGPGPQFDIWRLPTEEPENRLVIGECNFSQDKGTVYVIEDVAGVLDGAETITFRRQEKQGNGASARVKSNGEQIDCIDGI